MVMVTGIELRVQSYGYRVTGTELRVQLRLTLQFSLPNSRFILIRFKEQYPVSRIIYPVYNLIDQVLV